MTKFSISKYVLIDITPKTVCKVPICHKGKLRYKQIYFITDQKLPYKDILEL